MAFVNQWIFNFQSHSTFTVALQVVSPDTYRSQLYGPRYLTYATMMRQSAKYQAEGPEPMTCKRIQYAPLDSR